MVGGVDYTISVVLELVVPTSSLQHLLRVKALRGNISCSIISLGIRESSVISSN